MSASITDSLSTHLEQVADMVADYFEYDDSLASQLKPSKTVQATRYLYRVPYKRSSGGYMKKVSMDRGALGSGTGPVFSHFTAGFINTVCNFEVTQEQMDLSGDGAARVDVLNDILENAMRVASRHDNIHLFNDGTGKLTSASNSISGTTILVFDAATDTLGVNQLFVGMGVDVWDSTGATKRAGGPFTITNIDAASKTVTLSSAVTSLTAGDLLAVPDADAYGPSTLTSFSSTWPGGALTTAAGLTGDSFRHGLRYVNDSTSSNYYLGRLKSAYTDLMANRVNAEGANITFSHGELAKNRLLTSSRGGPKSLSGLRAVMHVGQAHALKDAGMAITRDIAQVGGQSFKDLMPTGEYGDVFSFAGVPAFASKIQDFKRVDYFNPSTWGRVEAHPTQFYKNPGNGSYIWPVLGSGGSAGQYLAAFEMRVKQCGDWVCEDPGAAVYIDNLAKPSGY